MVTKGRAVIDARLDDLREWVRQAMTTRRRCAHPGMASPHQTRVSRITMA